MHASELTIHSENLLASTEARVENNAHADDPNTLHSLDTAAWILKKTHWTLRYHIRRGNLRPVRLGRRLFFTTAELLRMLEKKRKKGK